MRRALVLFIALVAASALRAENWPQWRGPLFNGSPTETNLKASFSKQKDLIH